MDDLLNQVTGLTDRERKMVLLWVASQAEEKVIGIFQEGVEKSFPDKGGAPPTSPAGLASTALSLSRNAIYSK